MQVGVGGCRSGQLTVRLAILLCMVGQAGRMRDDKGKERTGQAGGLERVGRPEGRGQEERLWEWSRANSGAERTPSGVRKQGEEHRTSGAGVALTEGLSGSRGVPRGKASGSCAPPRSSPVSARGEGRMVG